MDKVVQAAPRAVLLSIGYIEGLAEAVKALELSRRKTPDWLAEVIFRLVEEEWIILDWDGEALVIEDDTIDVAHGDDASVTWPSALIRASGHRQRRPRQSLLLRLALYDIAFKAVGKPVRVIEH